jgi:hypothetical protein
MKTELMMFMNKFPQLNGEYYGKSNQIIRPNERNLVCLENGEHIFDFESFEKGLNELLDT